MKYPVP